MHVNHSLDGASVKRLLVNLVLEVSTENTPERIKSYLHFAETEIIMHGLKADIRIQS